MVLSVRPEVPAARAEDLAGQAGVPVAMVVPMATTCRPVLRPVVLVEIISLRGRLRVRIEIPFV